MTSAISNPILRGFNPDPSIVRGELKVPLLRPEGNEREGYVPNVVYTCGALLHRSRLILPFGISDTATTIVSVELDALLGALLNP